MKHFNGKKIILHREVGDTSLLQQFVESYESIYFIDTRVNENYAVDVIIYNFTKDWGKFIESPPLDIEFLYGLVSIASK